MKHSARLADSLDVDTACVATPEIVEPLEPCKHLPPHDLFPLPLTAFEKFMLVDDHRDYPRTYTVLLELTGQLHQAAFETAMGEVIQRNPLLSAIVRKCHSRWHWTAVVFPSDEVRWGEPVTESGSLRIDLRKQPGFRVSGTTDGVNSEIRFTFHHAVCDGRGARRVILDWLTAYAAIMAPEQKHVRFDQLDYERLRRRGEFTRTPPRPKTELVPAEPVTLMQRIRTIYQFLSQHPTPLRTSTKLPRLRGRGPIEILSFRFSRSEVAQFRDRLRGSRIRLNDVAIAILLNSIAKWNRSHGESGSDRLYRILVPVDLREPSDQFLPAANRLSFVFITRHTSLCLDWPSLLATIRAEMDYIEEHGSQYNLVNALPVIQSVPGIVGAAVKIPICFSTAVLTNLGDTFRGVRRRFPEENGRPVIGNLQFVRAGGAPPIRPKTRLGIGLTISLGELVVQSQFDSQTFSPEDAAEFMRQFAANWQNWGNSTPEYR